MQSSRIQYLLAVFVALLALVFSAWHVRRAGEREDFASYYVAGLNIIEGHSERLYEIRDPGLVPADRYGAIRARGFNGAYVNRYLYHPFWALLAAPLAHLRYRTAADGFVYGGVLVLFLWLAVALRLHKLSPLEAAMLGLCVLLFYPTRAGMDYGQFSIYALPLLGLVALAPTSLLSGALCGLVLLASPYLLPVLAALFLDREMRRSGITCLVFLVVATGISIAALGIEVMAEYMATVLSNFGTGESTIAIYAGRQSLLHQIYRVMVGTSMASEVAGSVEPLPVEVLVVYAVISAACLAAALWVGSRIKDAPGRIGVAIVGSLLASPHVWAHYSNVLFIPALWAIRAGPRLAGILATVGLIACNLPLRYGSGLTRLLTVNCWLGALAVGTGLFLASRTWRPRES